MFTAALFGWAPEVMNAPGMQYTVFKHGTDPVAGLMQLRPDMGAPHWATTFTVNDVDEAARRAVELGAELCVAPTDVPGVMRFCSIASPQGVAFSLVRWVPRSVD